MNDSLSSEQTPKWMEGKAINEAIFSSEFLKTHPMISVGGKFYTTEGLVHDEASLQREIFHLIKPYAASGLANKAKSLLDAIRIDCSMEDFPLETDRIHVANGTFYLNGELSEERQFCQNRFPVAVNICAGTPTRFLEFLNGLLYEDDIPTLQEYLGYCLIPCTKAQKMMIILGKGGEGKSRLGLILEKIIGTGITKNSIHKIETDRFARADLEGRLVMVDDDMEMTALPKTSILKTLITAESSIDLEKKGVQSYQGFIYSRLLCFGNGELTSVNDQSFGFYRRQLILRTKEAPADRVNDPFLVEKMEPELEAILMWCLAGLVRLQKNNYQFTISSRIQSNSEAIQVQVNTVEAFMESADYFIFDPHGTATSHDLFSCYLQFCNDNLFSALPSKTFIHTMHTLADRYSLKYCNHISNNLGKRVWGFSGIRTKYEL